MFLVLSVCLSIYREVPMWPLPMMPFVSHSPLPPHPCKPPHHMCGNFGSLLLSNGHFGASLSHETVKTCLFGIPHFVQRVVGLQQKGFLLESCISWNMFVTILGSTGPETFRNFSAVFSWSTRNQSTHSTVFPRRETLLNTFKKDVLN